MFETGGSSSEFYDDSPAGVNLGIGQQEFLMPEVSPGIRERGMGMAINRGHTHVRTFSHSPQPAYTPHPGDEFQAEDGHSAAGNGGIGLSAPSFHGGCPDLYLPPEIVPTQVDYADMPFMNDPSAHGNMDRGSFIHSYHPGEAPIGASGGPQFAFGPRPGIYSTQSSPGCIQHELPDTQSRHVGHIRHLSGEYLHAHRHKDASYGTVHNRSSSFGGLAQTHLAANAWDTYPAPTLYPAPTQLRVPSPSALFNAFGHYPPTGGTRRVPQMFKLATGRKKHSGKKQPMACLFCRERKIGCLRPPEDEPDQTCNQCARRDKRCEYPTESRRGQHNRTRFAAKQSPSVDESYATASGSSRPTTAGGSPTNDDGVDRQDSR